MHKYLIERTIPGAGSMTREQLADISHTSVCVLAGMGGRAQWIESYVTEDKITCVYLAEDPEALREHGATSGFPIDSIQRIAAIIDPSTAEGASVAEASR